MWIGKKIKDFAVTSPQLLLNQAPISVLLLAFLAPFFDTLPDVKMIPRDTVVALVLSGLAAALLVDFLRKFGRDWLIRVEFVAVFGYWADECVDV